MYRVMIVDDETTIREQLPVAFEWAQYGFEVVATAANGKDAAEKTGKYHPDLILLEKENVRTYSAPDVNGKAVNAEKMAETAAFYSAAAENAVPGYELMLENNFGIVFRKVQP